MPCNFTIQGSWVRSKSFPSGMSSLNGPVNPEPFPCAAGVGRGLGVGGRGVSGQCSGGLTGSVKWAAIVGAPAATLVPGGP